MNPIDQRPEHFAEMRDGAMACANCGAGVDAMRAEVRCPKAPRTVHGVDPHLYVSDPWYHARITATRLLMRHYRVPR